MADVKKPASPKQIVDVTHPGKSAPSDSSKPVLVTNRPMLKDPMMVDEDENTKTEGMPSRETVTVTKNKPAVDPLKATALPPPDSTEKSPAGPAKPSETTKSAEPATPAKDGDDEPSAAEQTEQQLAAEAEADAKHDAEIQKLVEAKQYFLPVNAVEKRRSQRVVILGIVLSVVLALAWADIALDAGLIQIGGVKPVTHFFSN